MTASRAGATAKLGRHRTHRQLPSSRQDRWRHSHGRVGRREHRDGHISRLGERRARELSCTARCSEFLTGWVVEPPCGSASRGPGPDGVWVGASCQGPASRGSRQYCADQPVRFSAPPDFEGDDGEKWTELQMVLRGWKPEGAHSTPRWASVTKVRRQQTIPVAETRYTEKPAARGLYTRGGELARAELG